MMIVLKECKIKAVQQAQAFTYSRLLRAQACILSARSHVVVVVRKKAMKS